MKIKNFLATAFVVALLISCSKENDGNGPVEGKETYVNVSFTPTGGAKTRATEDGTADESAIKTVDLYIFDKGTGIIVTHETLDITTDFNLVSGKYEGSKPVKTTTGNRYVLVGINLTTAIKNIIAGKTYIQVVNDVHDLSVAAITDVTDGFVMFSRTVADETFVDSPTGTGVENTVDVQVDRLAAKVIVTLDDTEANLPVNGGKIQNVQFNPRNINRKGYILPQTGYLDPNWSWTNAELSDLELLSGGTLWPANFVNEADADYKAVVEQSLSTHEVKYLTENTSQDHYQAETSYASIKLQFQLDTYCEFSSGVLTENVPNTTYTSFDEFYGVTVQEVRYFFYDYQQAEDYALSEGLTATDVYTYTNGYCYYNIFLNQKDDYDIQRNWYIKANITDVLAVGNPDPDPSDPGEKVETMTSMVVDITVMPWEVKEDSHSLRP